MNEPTTMERKSGAAVLCSDLVSPHQRLAIIAVAQVATEELLAAQLRLRTVEQIKDNILRCVYWREFMEAARAGLVGDDWLPGALGRVVLGWAKNGAHAG
jgi:hypothetical protein